MPQSKKRKRVYAAAPAAPVRRRGPSPVWLAPLMLTIFAIGVVWLVVFYVTGGDMPLVQGLGNGNLAVGFGFIVLGFLLATQWR